MIAKSPLLVPEFRFLALEEKFVEHMTRICELLRDYGDLKLPFDIMKMLAVLKTNNWQSIVPFYFYFNPLKQKLDNVTTCLLEMYEAGPLRCKYIIE
mgnify:CR=1 FL=1